MSSPFVAGVRARCLSRLQEGSVDFQVTNNGPRGTRSMKLTIRVLRPDKEHPKQLEIIGSPEVQPTWNVKMRLDSTTLEGPVYWCADLHGSCDLWKALEVPEPTKEEVP